MKKNKLLYWGEAPAPLIHTGFGRVSKHILKAIHETENYDINVIGINYFGQFYDQKEIPYHISPALVGNNAHPYGFNFLLEELHKTKYDVLMVVNDLYVADVVAEKVEEYRQRHNPNLKIVFYYPVDAKVIKSKKKQFIEIADYPIAYNQWSAFETKKVFPEFSDRGQVINHGVDTDLYCPLPKETRDFAREKIFGIKPNDDKFVFINVNRNSLRKDLPRCIYAFNKFKKDTKSNSILYLHTNPTDQGIDLISLVHELGMSTKTDVCFPVGYNLTDNALPDSKMNLLFNAGDALITTTLGEGWGLASTDSMASGLLNIAPLHTSYYEIMKNDRGITYNCSDVSRIDNNGYRPMGTIPEIVDAMKRGYEAAHTPEGEKIKTKAIEYCKEIHWKNIEKQWKTLFSSLPKIKNSVKMESI